MCAAKLKLGWFSDWLAEKSLPVFARLSGSRLAGHAPQFYYVNFGLCRSFLQTSSAGSMALRVDSSYSGMEAVGGAGGEWWEAGENRGVDEGGGVGEDPQSTAEEGTLSREGRLQVEGSRYLGNSMVVALVYW